MTGSDSAHYRELASAVKRQARELGFDLCGIAPAAPSAFKPAFRRWLEHGYHGDMGWLARDPDRRTDPNLVMPGARSIVAVGMNYYTHEPAGVAPAGRRAIFARYARGDDYHDVMPGRLRQLLESIRAQEPSTEGRVYVDTGPILEREVARRAGLGWFGKNTMLINTRRGSYFLLGELLLNLPLPPDDPAIGQCGTCTRCIDACPTGAIVRPYELDARRCISYLTIELKGPIPPDLAPAIGSHVFGCDVCQDVCPFNVRRASPSAEPSFQPRDFTKGSKITHLLYLTDEQFRHAFRGSPVKRAKRRGLLRNAAAALSPRDDPEAIAALEHALGDPEPLVREQARHSLADISSRR